MQISRKLPIAAVAMTLFAVAATSAGGLLAARQANLAQVEDKLTALVVEKRNGLERFLNEAESDAAILSRSKATIDALEFIGYEFDTMQGDRTGALQSRYITANPYPTGERHKLQNPAQDEYDDAHAHYHAYFSGLIEGGGFDDLLLIDQAGNIVYSVAKSKDFADNVHGRALAQTGLAAAFSATEGVASDSGSVFIDLTEYSPLGGKAAFVAHAVYKGNSPLGALVLRLPSNRLASVITGREGLGQHGTALLVNRAGSPLAAPTDTTEGSNPSVPALPSLDSEDQSVLVTHLDSYYGMEALAAIAPLTLSGRDIAVAAIVEEREALAGLYRMQNVMIGLALFVSLVCLGLAIWFSRTICSPLQRLSANMRSLAAGETDIVLDDARKDEIGVMARTVSVFRDAMLQKSRLEAEAEDSRRQVEQERNDREQHNLEEQAMTRQAVDALAEGLERLAHGDLSQTIDSPFKADLESLRQNFNDTILKLSKSLAKVRDSTSTLRQHAGQVRTAADDLARRTEQQATSVEETSTALEQITVNVGNAGDRAGDARRMVSDTRESARQSGEIVRDAVRAMQRIETASEEISNIINVIDEIAFQTNLLALNAGVEAARAGDAGKGFAVVAQEVRELAQRSATAAKDIKSLITKSGDEVQSGVTLVTAVAEALSSISDAVVRIDEHVDVIATGAKEQSTGIDEINTSIASIDQATQLNASMVGETNAVSQLLAQESDALVATVNQFRLREARPVNRREAENHEGSPARRLVTKVRGAFSQRRRSQPAEQDWSEF